MTLTSGEIVSLREHLQKQLDTCQGASRERLQNWITAHDEKHRLEAIAVERQREAIHVWQVGANEWRASLQDQRANMIERKEYEANHATLVDRVGNLETNLGAWVARMTTVGAALALGLVIVQILIRVLVP